MTGQPSHPKDDTTRAPGAHVGVLMLDTRFPRPVGDIGNPRTLERHGIPLRLRVVAGASPARVVRDADPTLLQPFVDAARALAEDGAVLITTSCGFLAAHQQALAAAVPVPVIASSLLACRTLARPGILTIDREALHARILAAVGVAPSTPVQGVEPGCEFHRRILGDEDRMDLVEAQRNVVDAARRLVDAHPGVEDLVLECTNMPPYREAIVAATGRRVHDIETLVLTAWRSRG
ncbi:MAG: aspartate/glutamate racemase family protein [Lautropia sp.]